MGKALYANHAVAALAAPITASATTLIVATGYGALFPSPTGGDYVPLVLEDRRQAPVKREIVYATLRAGDTFTILRAREGTLAQGFSTGAFAGNRMTAGVAQALADAAGEISSLWLGVHATHPTTDNAGNPLTIGALYWNSVTFTNYAWDGNQWRSQFQPAPSVASRLFYNATGGQTEFGNVADLWGNTLNLNAGSPVPVLVFKNGELLFLDDGSGTLGDYTVNHATNRIVLLAPAALNDGIELQQLAEALTVGVVDKKKLRSIDLDPASGTPGYINGARATFKIRDVSNNPLTPDNAQALELYLDGVQQEPGVDYTVATDEVTFDANLPAGTSFWGTYYDSMVA